MKSLELRAALCCLVSGGLGAGSVFAALFARPRPGALGTCTWWRPRYSLWPVFPPPGSPGPRGGHGLLPNRSSKRAAIG
jgi:hypothetical protein